MNSSLPLDEKTRDAILAAAARHGAYNVRVFGSRARGDHRPDSDLDLLVEFEEGRSLLDLIGMQYDLEEAIGIPVQVVTPKSLSRFFRDEVLAMAVAL